MTGSSELSSFDEFPQQARGVSRLWEFLTDFLIGENDGEPNERAFPEPLTEPFDLGKFRLEAVLGHGAHGVVFRATDLHLGRKVAVKCPWPWMLSPKWDKYLKREPQTLATLKHPGIVQVYDSGDVSLAFIIILELIEGPTLSQWMKNQSHVAPRTAAIILHQVSSAMAKAHELGITHRDLKPSNILLRPIEVSGDFSYQPVVTDFGMARQNRIVETIENATTTIAFVGTDYYMSPEQASGQSGHVEPSSDVFSLGVIMFELLTGKRPFDGQTPSEIRERIQHADSPSLRRQRPDVPRDLETIILKCLAKSPGDRYASAETLAEDLRRFLANEPIAAKPAPAWKSALLWVRRHPVTTSALAVSLFGMLLLAGIAGAWINDRHNAFLRTEEAERIANKADLNIRRRQYKEGIQKAYTQVLGAKRREAIEILDECKRIAQEPMRCGPEWHFVNSLVRDAKYRFQAYPRDLEDAVLSPSGDMLFTAGGSTGDVIGWDIKTWQPKKRLTASSEASSLAFSPNGEYLAVGGKSGQLVILRIRDDQVCFDEKIVDDSIGIMEWIGESDYLAIPARRDLSVLFVKPDQSGIFHTVRIPRKVAIVGPEAPYERIRDIAYIPAKSVIAVAAGIQGLHWIDVKRLELVPPLLNSTDSVQHLAFVPEGTGFLLTCDNVSQLKLWNMTDGTLNWSAIAPETPRGFRYLKGCQRLMTFGKNGQVLAIDLSRRVEGNKVASSVRGMLHNDRVLSLVETPDGSMMISAGYDGEIASWDRNDAWWNEIRLQGVPTCLKFSNDSRHLAVTTTIVSGGWNLRMIDVEARKEIWSAVASVPAPKVELFSPFTAFAWLEKTHEIASIEIDFHLRTRNIETGKVVRQFPKISGLPMRQVFASLDGDTLAVHRFDDPLLYIDVEKGSPSSKQDGDRSFGMHHTLLGDVWIGLIHQQDLVLRRSPDAEPILKLSGPHSTLRTIAISADGKMLAAAGDEQLVYIWNLQTGESKKCTEVSTEVDRLCFSNDGKTLLGATMVNNGGGDVTFWDVETTERLLSVGGYGEAVFSMDLSPDGRYLAIGFDHSGSYSIRLYPLKRDSSN